LALLIDTDVAIRLRNRDRAIGDALAARRERKHLSLVSVVELEGGVAARPQFAARRRAALDALLFVLDVLPFDADVVSAYARILARTGFSRTRILDRLIAATAIVHDLTLVTINGADFRDIPGLKLEVWAPPAQ
jgi:tRNA(fMet)-specific endonuclease VapC